MTKECNRCGVKGLEWDTEFHDKNNKWRLKDGVTGKPHFCSKDDKGNKGDYWWPSKELMGEIWRKLTGIIKHCDVCNSDYNLANPCDHHLPDGPRFYDRRKYIEDNKNKSLGINVEAENPLL